MASVGFFHGLGFPLRGARFVYLKHPGLIRFWIVPVLLTAIALATAGYVAVVHGPVWAEALWAAPQQSGFLGNVLGGIHAVYTFVLALLLGAVGVLICVACSTVLAAPFNDALSREVERIVTGHSAPSGVGVSFVLDLMRTVGLELLKLAIYAAIMLPLMVGGWVVPGIGHVVTSPMAALLSVTFLAVDYVDWPAARRDWPIGRRLGLLRAYPRLMLGFGLGVWALLFVPLVNLLFMPAAVAGGTLMFLGLDRERGESSESV